MSSKDILKFCIFGALTKTHAFVKFQKPGIVAVNAYILK